MIGRWNEMDANEIINKKFKELKQSKYIFLIFSSFIIFMLWIYSTPQARFSNFLKL